MEMQQSLQIISKWGSILGYMTIVSGSIFALGGLFLFIIGALPGVLTIFYGIYLVKSAKQAQILLTDVNNEQATITALDYYGKYIRLYGVTMVVYFILGIIGTILIFYFLFYLFGLMKP
ncbi:DUF5362 family protein [Alkalihalobacterium bogoriense]|uniref:DUF5362 family protein n=1 Tax=Alkalihalobacterium bogoriense TaxID=246272 RepID=UPI00047C4658|nr:DUF5362 family protein [Alkalihalobacterium bogoriense]